MNSTQRMVALTVSLGVLVAVGPAECADLVTAAPNIAPPASGPQDTNFEAQVDEYLRLFPYQETYRYAMLQTKGDPGRLNTWAAASRDLLKAGEDAIVRSNNDTLYKMAWLYLGYGPVMLGSASPSNKRFTSFQLQDDRNANYRNVIQPAGRYTLYYGEKPTTVTGEAIEVPSLLSAVIVRIEVKNKNEDILFDFR